MRGRGSKAVWIFSENSSVLVALPIPKDEKFAEKFLQRMICQERFVLSENAKDANIAGQLLGTG